MTIITAPLKDPVDCNLDTKDALEAELVEADGGVCYQLALKLQKAVDQGTLVFTQDGRLVAATQDATGGGPDESQFHHAWTDLMHTLGIYVPQQLTLATKYRALFSHAVTYKRGTLKG